MADVKNLIAAEEARDVGRAIRHLLARPMITYRADPDTFTLIRRHQAQVEQWFSYFCGWRLNSDARSGHVRLFKQVTPHARQPLARPRSKTKTPFDRRRYMLLCLAAAELLHRPVTLIGRLGEDIAHVCGGDAELLSFEPSHGPHRSALVDVVVTLAQLSAVEIVDGTVDSYGSNADHAVLLRGQPAILMSLLASPQPPSRLEVRDIATLTADPRLQGDPTDTGEAGRARYNITLRYRVMRQLADEAVVYFDRLDPDALDYVRTLTGRKQVAWAAQQAGMIPEFRTEGIMWIDPDKIATDVTFPDAGSNQKQAALLLLDYLQTHRDVTIADLEQEVHRLLGQYPRWAQEYRVPGGAARMVDAAVSLLADFALVEATSTTVTPLPAASRYLIEAPRTTGDKT